jgi:hypothetical protein
VRKKAAELLKALQRQVDSEVRRKILEELAGIKDIDQLIERTAADRDELRRQTLESKSALSRGPRGPSTDPGSIAATGGLRLQADR